MTYIKTELGLTALKDRHAVALSRGQRSALILFDGIRSAGAVLAATGALGVSKADIDTLVSLGLLQAAPDSKPQPRPPQDAPQTDFASSTLAAHYADMELPVAPNTPEERMRRYQKAYPLATQITAKLGLRGFRLNLAVESAQGFEGLVALLPKMRAAVGDEGIKPMVDALEGR